MVSVCRPHHLREPARWSSDKTSAVGLNNEDSEEVRGAGSVAVEPTGEFGPE
ncbi:hypothetical protein Hanom_Chr12g01097781 [Helianthus anomalus]